MIGVGDLYRIASRTGQYGQSSSSPGWSGTIPAQDILDSINVRLTRIWAAANWRWRHEALSIPMVSGQSVYPVTVVSGQPIDRIMNLYPLDMTVAPPIQGKPLTEMTERQFFSKCDIRPGRCAGGPESYWNCGMDANNVWSIQVYPVPSSAFSLKGSAKMVLTTYTLADILANNPILYFPNGVVLDCALTGILSDIAGCKGDPVNQGSRDASFEAKLKLLMGEQLGVATDETPITSDPPAMLARGGYPGFRRR